MEVHPGLPPTLKYNSVRCLGLAPTQLPMLNFLSSFLAGQLKMQTNERVASPKWSPPSSTSTRPLTVLGGGDRARRIACLWASAGYNVNIQDSDSARCDAALRYIYTNASSFVDRLGRKSFRIGQCRTFKDIERAANDAWLIIEACQGQQQSLDVLGALGAISPADCIFASASAFSGSSHLLSKMNIKHQSRVCSVHYSVLPRDRTVELLSCQETEPAILPFLVELHKKMGMISSTAHGDSKGMAMLRIWAAVKREVLTVLAEGVAEPEEIDTLWKEMFSNPIVGPCAMMDEEGLDEVAEREDQLAWERHLDTTFTSDYLRLKYIQDGRLGTESSKGGLISPNLFKGSPNGSLQAPKPSTQPTLFFLDVGVGENVHSMEEARTAGKILTTTPSGIQTTTIVTGQSYPDGLDISLRASRLFWTNMGVTGSKDGTVMSSTLTGTDIRCLIPPGTLHTPKQLAIDHENSHLYFSDREGLSVSRCNFDGSHLERLILTGDPSNPSHASDPLRFCIGVAVDPATHTFYWTQKGPAKAGQGRIFRAGMTTPPNSTPSNRPDIELLFSHLPECVDLDYEPATRSLWWTDRGEHPGGNSVNVSYVGPTPEATATEAAARKPKLAVMPHRNILTRHLHEAIGIRLDVRNRCVYVCDLGGAVYCVGMDEGGGKRVVLRTEAAYTGIALAYL